jgi:hypothetical protein
MPKIIIILNTSFKMSQRTEEGFLKQNSLTAIADVDTNIQLLLLLLLLLLLM